jgi:methanogenic corrinoid protein MtbC1/uroporphyrinogen-III decarboxylase
MDTLLRAISDAVQAGQRDRVVQFVQKALGEGAAAETILEGGLIPGMHALGERFRDGEAYLPEILISARAMNAALEALKPSLTSRSTEKKGTVVLGTIRGDLHDIGKNLVRLMLEGNGFKVVDLGVDVEPDRFAQASWENDADVIAVSSLLTTTMTEISKVIQSLEAANLRCRGLRVGRRRGGSPDRREEGRSMTASRRERFLDIARFQRTGDLFIPSSFQTCWPQTRRRWQREGAPVDPHSDVALHRFLGFDRCRTLIEIRSGLLIIEGPTEHTAGFSYLPPLDPLYPLELVEEDERTITVLNGARIKERILKDDREKMPQWLDAPVKDKASWDAYKKHLDPHSAGRWPEDWDGYARRFKERDYPLGLFAGSLFGWLNLWMGTERLLLTFYDDPKLIEEMMDHVVYFVEQVIERVVEDIEVDWAYIWEDMAFKSGPFISPELFRKFMLPRYRKITDVLRRNGVDVIIVDSDGNTEKLIPLWIESGVNGQWPLEVAAGMDAVALRKEYGKDFVLLGNIDKRSLNRSKDAIRDEVMRKVPFLLEQGGYFPGVDHTIPPDISFENFRYFVNTMRDVAGLEKL